MGILVLSLMMVHNADTRRDVPDDSRVASRADPRVFGEVKCPCARGSRVHARKARRAVKRASRTCLGSTAAEAPGLRQACAPVHALVTLGARW